MMSMSPMSIQNHVQRHQELIRERANDRLAQQIAANKPTKIRSMTKSALNSLFQWGRQQLTHPTHQPCPQPILRESDI